MTPGGGGWAARGACGKNRVPQSYAIIVFALTLSIAAYMLYVRYYHRCRPGTGWVLFVSIALAIQLAVAWALHRLVEWMTHRHGDKTNAK